MKNANNIIPAALLAAMALLAMFAFSTKGEQAQGTEYQGRYWQNLTAFTTDTIANAETLTYSLGTFNRPVAVEVQIAADSLSGTMASTVTLEQSINGADWFVVDTETLSGTTVRLKATGDVLGGTLRVRSVSTGTQSTALRMDAIVTDSAPAQ